MMKTLFTLLLSIFSLHVMSQSGCEPFLPSTVGSTWELTNYSNKGTEVGKVVYELLEKEVSGNDIKFTVDTKTFDKKGEETFSSAFSAFCKNGHYELDMGFMMNAAMMQAYQDMDVDIDASDFEIPSMQTDAGTNLNDASLTIQIASNNVNVVKITVNVTDRKVEAKESLSTPAGSFDCLVLSQKVYTKMMIKIEGASKEWYAEGIGVVRSESYNKKGKLNGYTELTKLDIK